MLLIFVLSFHLQMWIVAAEHLKKRTSREKKIKYLSQPERESTIQQLKSEEDNSARRRKEKNTERRKIKLVGARWCGSEHWTR